MIAQASEAIRIGEMFGFAALVAFVLLIGSGWLAKRVVDWWIMDQTARSLAEREREELESADRRAAYQSQVEVGKAVLTAIDKLTNLNEQSVRAVELIANTNETKLRLAKETNIGVRQIHEAVRESLLVAADMLAGETGISERLRKIAFELETQE